MFFVRTAMERDLLAVCDLLTRTWHAAYDGIYGRERVEEITGARHTVDTLRPRIGRRDAEFLVADDGSSLGGVAFAAYGADRSVAVLHQLYVDPGVQRGGIGGDLLSEIAGGFPEALRLRAEVEKDNAGAMAFFARHGFVDAGPANEADGPLAGVPARIMEQRFG